MQLEVKNQLNVVSPFHQRGSGNQIQVIRLCSNYFEPNIPDVHIDSYNYQTPLELYTDSSHKGGSLTSLLQPCSKLLKKNLRVSK